MDRLDSNFSAIRYDTTAAPRLEIARPHTTIPRTSLMKIFSEQKS
jgi:hypothetical protein